MAAEILYAVGKDPLNERGGGHSSYVRAHARAAVRAGFAPHLFCVGDSNLEIETDFGTIHHVYSPWRPRRQLMIAGHAPRLAAAMVNFVESSRRAETHLIHGFGLWGYAGVVACRQLAEAGITARPILSSYTTYEDEARSQLDIGSGRALAGRVSFRIQHFWIRAAVEKYEHLAYLNSELVLINYESVRRLIERKYGKRVRCLKVPYSSEISFDVTDTPPIPPAASAESRAIPLIVSVASHHPRKGNDILLDALKLLKDAGRSFKACLIGGGPLLEEHRCYAHKLNITDRTILTGLVDDVRPYLRSADIFVLPSIAEQSGSLAVIEALQSGLPIVTTAVDGLSEDLTNDHDALLVPTTSVSLAGALSRLFDDDRLRTRLSKNALQTFNARFSPNHFSRALRSIYEQLLARPLSVSAADVCI